MPDAHPDTVKATTVTIPAGGEIEHTLDAHCRGLLGIGGDTNAGTLAFVSGGATIPTAASAYTKLDIMDIGLRGKSIFVGGTAADTPTVLELIGQGEVAH